MAQIEGDGPSSNIFRLLWSKEGSHSEKAQITIPETVIFANGTPTIWYFTSIDGQILKKMHKNITFDNICKKFTSQAEDDEIVAYFITTDTARVDDRLLLLHNKGTTAEVPS